MSRYHSYALPYYVDDILDATTTPHVDGSGHVTQYQLFWGNPLFNGTNPAAASITYSFLDDPSVAASSGFSNFSPLTADERTAAIQALQIWSNIANVTFSQVSSANSGQIRFGNADNGAAPNNIASYHKAGINGVLTNVDVFVGPSSSFGSQVISNPNSPIGLNSFLVQIEWALGGATSPTSSAPEHLAIDGENNTNYSILADQFAPNLPNVFAITPMIDDIAAIQAVYGANLNYRSGNDLYQINLNQTAVLSTIWDGGGNDTIDSSQATGAVLIDLRPGLLSGDLASGALTLGIAYNCIIENAIGGAGNDSLVGNNANNQLTGGGGDDSLGGGGGDDWFWSGGGADTLEGGSGSDWASYHFGAAGVSVNLAAGGNTGSDAAGDVLANIENLYGSTFGDLLVGDANANAINGDAGDDMIEGGAGADTLDGGAGNNTISYAGSSAGVIVNLATQGVTGGAAQGDSIAQFQSAIGSAFNDILVGASGATMLHGGAGNDTLRGGGGSNTFVFNAGAGHDLVLDLKAGTGGDLLRFGSVASSSLQLADLKLNSLLLQSGSTMTMAATVGAWSTAGSQTLPWWQQYLGGWTVAGTGDFNGSGRDGILARYGTTQTAALYYFDVDKTGTLIGAVNLAWWSQYVANWRIVGLGDLDGDARTDIFGRDPATSALYCWSVTGDGSIASSTSIGWWQQYVPGWQIVSTNDFTGDGRADILGQDPGTKATYLWTINADGSYAGGHQLGWWSQYVPNWTIVSTADFSGDGRADILGQDPASRSMYLWTLNADGSLASSAALGWWTQYVANWTVAKVGDFTGDGRADIIAQSPDRAASWLFTIDNQGNLTGSVDLSAGIGAGQTIVGGGTLAGLSTRVTTPGGDTVDVFGVKKEAIAGNLQTSVVGTAGADALAGDSGNNLLTGGAGNDTLTGNGGTDAYAFGRGDGQDVIQNAPGNTMASGELGLGAGIATNQLWLVHSGNDLVVEILGTSDRTTISGWYNGAASQLQRLTAADGSMLDNQLNTLVSAMATFQADNPGFDPTASGNSQAPNDPNLQAAIAAAWHH